MPEDEQTLAIVTQGIREVSDGFAEEEGRKPSAAELFEILTWGLRSGDKEKLSDVHLSNLIALRPRFKKRAPGRELASNDTTGVAVSGLNDAVFVAANDLFRTLIDAVLSKTGHLPSLSNLRKLLIEGLHRCGERLLADVAPAEVTDIKVELRTGKRITPRVGDIVAIPAPKGKSHIAVVLAKNRFGTAFGIFEGTGRIKPISEGSHPPVKPRPVYSGDHLIESGRWKIIGHDEALLELFPGDPEIYHRQDAGSPDPILGPYGAGETESGRLRQLTKEEVEDIGLFSDKFRQTYGPEALEDCLNAELK